MHSMMGSGEGPPKGPYAGMGWAPSSPLGGRHGGQGNGNLSAAAAAAAAKSNPYAAAGAPSSYSSVLSSSSSSIAGGGGGSSSSGAQASYNYANAASSGGGGTLMGQGMGGSVDLNAYYTSPSMQTSPGAGGRAPLHRYTAGSAAAAGYPGPGSGSLTAQLRSQQHQQQQLNYHQQMVAAAMNGDGTHGHHHHHPAAGGPSMPPHLAHMQDPQSQRVPRPISRSLLGEMNQVSSLLQHGGEQLEREEEKQLLMMNEKRNHFKRGDGAENGLVTFGGEANSWNGLDLSKMGLSLISKRLAFFGHITCLFLNDNKLSAIPEAVFTLKKLNKLDLSNNQITKLPPQLGRLVHLQELSLGGNKIRELPFEMGKLFRLKSLILDNNPIVSPPPTILKQGVETTISYLREKAALPPPPPERTWVSIKQPTSEQDCVRVLCYNVLAEKYAVPELLCYCPLRYLKYEHRKQQILKEMLAHECDFIALQEVEAGHYKTFYEPQMSKMGYGGTYRPKSRARTMMDSSSVDGCVLFHKTNKYKILEEFWIEYQSNSIKRYEKEFPGSVDALDRLMTKDQIAVATVFRCIHPSELKTGKPDPKEKERILVVVNTHIHWDPEYPDVKIMQVCMLMEELETVISSNKRYAGAPIIICGDFNSMPDSGVYKYIREGKLESNHADFNGFDYGRYTREGPRHPFRIASAYETIGEPTFTNFTGNFTGCLDYIFYSSDKLEVCKILKPVDEEVVLNQTGALPNAYMCSDHIPLACEFQFVKASSRVVPLLDGARDSWRRSYDEPEFESEDDGLDDGRNDSSDGGGTYAPWASRSGHDYWSNDNDGDNGRFY